MKFVKTLFGLAVAAFVAVGFAAQSSAQDIQKQIANESALTEIKKRGVLNVGHSTFVPWSFRSVKGEFVGFEIDMGRKLAEDMGVKYNNVPTAWDGIIPALLAGKFDLIVGGMSPTPKRALTVSFSVPYSNPLHQGFAANRKLITGLNSIEDYNKSSITIVSRRGSTAEDAAKKHLPKATHRLFDDDAMAIQEVLNGNAHAVFSSEPKPSFWALENADSIIKPFGDKAFSDNSGAGVAVRQGDSVLLTYVNNWISWRRAGGFIQDRFNFWFGTLDWAALDPKRVDD
jgi:polar amino acid transport system substrate-binding protein